MNNEVTFDPTGQVEFPPLNQSLDYVDNLPNGECPNGNFFYINEWNSDTIIPSLNSTPPPEVNGQLIQIMKIKSEYQNFLSEKFAKEVDFGDEEFKEIKKTIDDSVKQITSTMEIFEKQQHKVLQIEKKMEKSYDMVRNDFKKIDDFSSFISKIDSKYNGINNKKLTESILEICESIQKESDNLDIKQEYQKELYILQYLFHNFIKKINQGNIGSTCTLCLQNQVDTFLEPCGHTACSGCIEKFSKKPVNRIESFNNDNCFICRQKVFKFHKLYFV